MPHAVKSNLFLYADDSCLAFQGKDVIEIEKQLNKDYANISEWFVDKRLSILYILIYETKSIYFASKRKIKKVPKLNTKYKVIKIKQHSKVSYLGCIIDNTSQESQCL